MPVSWLVVHLGVFSVETCVQPWVSYQHLSPITKLVKRTLSMRMEPHWGTKKWLSGDRNWSCYDGGGGGGCESFYDLYMWYGLIWWSMMYVELLNLIKCDDLVVCCRPALTTLRWRHADSWFRILTWPLISQGDQQKWQHKSIGFFSFRIAMLGSSLGGGGRFIFTPIFFWGRWTHFWGAYFSKGLVQPPNNGQKGGLGRLVVWIPRKDPRFMKGIRESEEVPPDLNLKTAGNQNQPNQPLISPHWKRTNVLFWRSMGWFRCISYYK